MRWAFLVFYLRLNFKLEELALKKVDLEHGFIVSIWAGAEQSRFKGHQKITKDNIVVTELLFRLKLQLKLTCLKDCEDTKSEEKHWLHVDFA